jgi:hypothetical protein
MTEGICFELFFGRNNSAGSLSLSILAITNQIIFQVLKCVWIEREK